jgi:hypothetical protein
MSNPVTEVRTKAVVVCSIHVVFLRTHCEVPHPIASFTLRRSDVTTGGYFQRDLIQLVFSGCAVSKPSRAKKK